MQIGADSYIGATSFGCKNEFLSDWKQGFSRRWPRSAGSGDRLCGVENDTPGPVARSVIRRFQKM
jgi:hypothetical protein